jgi:Lrp/AsnC family transcriptional regulator, leucine-responsive regulatory protein
MARIRRGGDVHDETDLDILRELRKDGRLSIASLAERVHLSRASAYSRVERLTADGVVEGFSARVDSRLLGLGIAALVLITAKQPAWRQLRQEIERWEEVEFFAFTTGPFDAMMLVRVDNLQTLRDVILERLQSMPDIRSTQTVFLLEEVIRRPYVVPALDEPTRREPVKRP